MSLRLLGGALFMYDFQPGRINKISFPSELLERDVTLSIYLPKDFSELFKYKVVFCFDGLDFLVLEEFIEVMKIYVKRMKLKKQSSLAFIMKTLINAVLNFIHKERVRI